MPIYMTRNRYSPEAMSHMISNADIRKEQIGKHLEQAGGKLIEYYFCYGEYDAVGIYEMPDRESALAILAAVEATGFVTEMETTELFTTDEAADAFKKAKEIVITPPKG